jgi:hypothetical protein
MNFKQKFDIEFENIMALEVCNHCYMPFICSVRKYEIYVDIYAKTLANKKNYSIIKEELLKLLKSE